MALKLAKNEEVEKIEQFTDEEDDEELEDWGDWRANDDDDDEGEDLEPRFLCLFCDYKFGSHTALFDHCCAFHRFDFNGLRKTLALDFYHSLKLINYVRSQVAENKCWSCGILFESNQELQTHLHETDNFKATKLLWDDDKYLKPFMQDDPLLYSFGGDEVEDDYTASVDKEEPARALKGLEEICVESEIAAEVLASDFAKSDENRSKMVASASNGYSNEACPSDKLIVNGIQAKEHLDSCNVRDRDDLLRVSFSNAVAKEIKNVNENYFGAYSSFGIHREMISDKARMDSYRHAILKNPSLLNDAVVMDVGCGTGILSLFAAQAGASRVIAIEASDKMAKVASQIAKDNGLLRGGNLYDIVDPRTGVIEVVQSMVEELDKSIHIQPHSIDVLLSEWMGYCLLYESMLSSVLFARDLWLKPGGAILPDTATIFVAGFGRGGTSIPFWENVYGFNMSCVGKELLEDAARVPIVDVVDSHDIVTNAAVLQTFDLATMKLDEMDFTASIELEPKSDVLVDRMEPGTTWCYGVVLWFETGFTIRFCKEMPTVLSTSPYNPKTHWSQTILTFREPIAVSSGKCVADKLAAVGTGANPAVKILTRISIARASQHRSIDISLEAAGIGEDGRKHIWPVQIFNLC